MITKFDDFLFESIGKKYFYHATKNENLTYIYWNGLIPSKKSNWSGDLGDFSIGKVFMTSNFVTAKFYGSMINKTNPSPILRIDGGVNYIIDKNGSKINLIKDKKDKKPTFDYYTTFKIECNFEILINKKWVPLTLDIIKTLD